MSLLNLASLGFGHALAIVAAARAAGIARGLRLYHRGHDTLAARSKQVRLAAEQQVRESALDWTILRPTMIYGDAGDRNLSRLLLLLPRAPVLPVPGGGATCSSRSTWPTWPTRCWPRRRSGRGRATYDVAGPEPLTFTELLRISARAVGSRTRFVPVPLPRWSRPPAATSC